jgi:hypothetical protein
VLSLRRVVFEQCQLTDGGRIMLEWRFEVLVMGWFSGPFQGINVTLYYIHFPYYHYP